MFFCDQECQADLIHYAVVYWLLLLPLWAAGLALMLVLYLVALSYRRWPVVIGGLLLGATAALTTYGLLVAAGTTRDLLGQHFGNGGGRGPRASPGFISRLEGVPPVTVARGGGAAAAPPGQAMHLLTDNELSPGPGPGWSPARRHYWQELVLLAAGLSLLLGGLVFLVAALAPRPGCGCCSPAAAGAAAATVSSTVLVAILLCTRAVDAPQSYE
ncbi:Derlin-2.2 [Frankliniella fusca]|uniref:Derlin-2.2 n=1 Tax=Frankliniella fusca TaxID=407009 RepID=A0AAE1HFQ1_9NEOP|nr:Derlin-2.2 [Frankliniella fusca]